MNVSFAQVKTIMDTLPIGYYAGKRVSVTLEPQTAVHTSYYSPIDETIVIDYPIIAERLQKAPDTADVEEAVRSMLYHEVSHAILTPKALVSLLSDATQEIIDVVNIFEDERIETILSNYYHNVNFRKQLSEITSPNTGTDCMSKFFDLVRFHIGPKPFLEKVTQMIKDYQKLTACAERYATFNYLWAINDLWEKFKRYYKTNPQPQQPQAQNANESSTGNANDSTSAQTQQAEQTQQTKELVDISAETAEQLINSAINDNFLGNCPSKKREQVKKQIVQFETEVNRIFDNFHRKNNSGNGINAYSGVFNPRAVARQDYRYFDRALPNNGNNKFGTCHLNCFIDVSGSFESASPLVNSVLGILTKIEKRNRNFTMSVIHINTEWHEAQDYRDREFTANDGNDLPSDIKERFNKLQKKNTYIHNLVLFDGDAFSSSDKLPKECAKVFSTFDTPTTTLITDRDNEELCKDFHSGNVIITNKYTDELLKNILLSLQKAFN